MWPRCDRNVDYGLRGLSAIVGSPARQNAQDDDHLLLLVEAEADTPVADA